MAFGTHRFEMTVPAPPIPPTPIQRTLGTLSRCGGKTRQAGTSNRPPRNSQAVGIPVR